MYQLPRISVSHIQFPQIPARAGVTLNVKGSVMHLRLGSLLAVSALFAALIAVPTQAQPAIQPSVDITQVPAAAQPSPNFNADAATEAYLAMIPAAATARSNAYFEGGYWLILWDFLYASAISLILLEFGWSARMRDLAERITRKYWPQVFLYGVQYVLLTFVLGFPLEVYENFIREHQYGLATQTFGPWMGDEGKALLMNLIGGSIVIAILFTIVRKWRQTWWILGSIATMVMLTVLIAISPVFLRPIFNKIVRLDDPKVTAPILRLLMPMAFRQTTCTKSTRANRQRG